MIIEGNKEIVQASIQEVYQFLTNAENIELLLPKNDVKDFKGDQTSCSFKVQGGITISLVQTELIENERIGMKSGDKSPFPFQLKINLLEKGVSTEGQIIFDGEVNAFMSMMVKKPLENLFNYMTERLRKVFETKV